MNILLYIAIVVLVIYFDPELVKTALAPIIDIMASVFFIAKLIGIIMAELALMVVAPIALLLGFESRDWHKILVTKLLHLEKTNDAK